MEETEIQDSLPPANVGPPHDGPFNRSASWKFALVAILASVVLFAVTVPASTADTPEYVAHILSYHQHRPDVPLWEFGHLLWRPLGYAVWQLTHPLLSSWSQDNPVLEITADFVGINFLVGLILAPLLFFLCRRLGLSVVNAAGVASGFMLSSTILNYAHTGMSYNPGLAAQMAGLLLILNAVESPGRGRLYAVLAGTALAVSFLLWFPYVLTVPVVLLAGWMVHPTGNPSGRPDEAIFASDRLRVIALATAATVAIGLATFGIGAVIEHIASFLALKQWILNSAHGMMVERRLARLPTGLTRSFFYLGSDGIVMKRFAMGDPYAPVHTLDLIRAGIWKVLLVFLAMLILFVTLARRRSTWPALILLAAGWIPTLAFSLFLFETSEPARYEPAYPSLLIGLCSLFLLPREIRLPRWFFATFFVLLAIVNLKAYVWDLRSLAAATNQRVLLIHEHTAHGGVAFVLSFRDGASSYMQKLPFSRLNRPGALPLFHVIEAGNISVVTWRKSAACRILQAWDEGGETWLSTRLVAQRPKPEWEWAEFDDLRVRWVDLPAFFTRFETNGRIGGEDGFVRVAPTANNRQTFVDFCRSAGEAGSLK
jgi:hypothetical protein